MSRATAKTDVAIVGGGAAGLMAAITAGEAGRQVTIFEKKQEPGQKILLTGDGRCNLTSTLSPGEIIEKEVFQCPEFLYGPLYTFSPDRTWQFFTERGFMLKEERGRRVYPETDKAENVRNFMVSQAKKADVRLKTEHEVKAMWMEAGKLRGVILAGSRLIEANKVIVATGGISYPGTGSTGDGYKLAGMAGHQIVEPKLALVPIRVEEDWTEEAAGLKLKNVDVKLYKRQGDDEVMIYQDRGEAIIEANKLTGALPLAASCHLDDDYSKFQLGIDMKPSVSQAQLERRLEKDFKNMAKKYFRNSLKGLLPAWLRPVIVDLSIIPSAKQTNQITAAERNHLAGLLKDIRLQVVGIGGKNEAIVTAGGIKASEVDPRTMESKLMPGLFFAGETLEPAAYTGGHNLQIAFATGHIAGLDQ
ncbi:MAG: NAD(P)/FAD-dependent oxidoreductase [Bacillota bacterium]